jgi:AcrR family transcriptional regulator
MSEPAADLAHVAPGEPSLADQHRNLARARIIRAAREVLAKRGLSTTVDEVADAADVSRRTVFRYFATRENLFAAAIRDSLRSYGERLPPMTGVDLDAWVLALLVAVHRLNAHNGRMYWELAALEPELTGEIAVAAAERRERRKRFAARVASSMWRTRGGSGRPPAWFVDAVAVHLSGFTTQSLGGDFGRDPDDVAKVSQRVLLAALDAALADSGRLPD